MRMNIQTKLLGGFIVVIILLIVISSVSLFSMDRMSKQAEQIDTIWMPSVALLGTLNGDVSDVERLALNIIFQGSSEEKANVKTALDELLIKIAGENVELEKLIQTDEERRLYKQYTTKYDAYVQQLPTLLQLSANNNMEAARQLHLSMYPTWWTANDAIYQLTLMNTDKASKLTDESVSTSHAASNNISILSVIAILLALLIAWLIARSVSTPVKMLQQAAEQISSGDLTGKEIQIRNQDEIGLLATSFNTMKHNLRQLIEAVSSTSESMAASSEQLTASSEHNTKATEDIAYSIQEVAAGTTQQVDITAKSSQAMQEMSSGALQIAIRAQTVATSAIDAASRSSDGNVAIHQAVSQMDSVQQTMSSLATVAQELGKRSQKIGNITEMITNISSQTNLLALNAAIEAARAGDAGAGFAVVANEVRSLAEQSAMSARHISELVAIIQKEIINVIEAIEMNSEEVAKGMQSVSIAGEAFADILQAVNRVASDIEDVTSSAEQMSARTEEILQYSQQISRIAIEASTGTFNVSAATQEQLASMQQIASSAAALSQTAEQLQERILVFKV